MDQNLDQLAAALNDHQITDEEGALTEGNQPSIEESATQEEKNTFEETATPEKATESKTSSPKDEAEEDENIPAVDEKGRRYIPEKRFKEVYGKAKALERELEAERRTRVQGSAPVQERPEAPIHNSNQPTKADALEVEMLKEKYSQFDPDSKDYSRTLDEMGAEILKSNPGITRLEAARRVLRRAKELSNTEASIKSEARIVKQQQSDQGITSRVLSGRGTKVSPDNMSLQEKEEWLKANGQW